MDQDATWYTEVGLGPGDIVLDGNPASPTERGTAVPHFSAHFPLARSPISAAAEHLLLTKQRMFDNLNTVSRLCRLHIAIKEP